MSAQKVYWCRDCKRNHVRLIQAVPDKPAGWGRQLVLDFTVAVLFMAAIFTSLLWVGTR